MKKSEMQQIIKDFLFEKVMSHFVSMDGEFGEMMYDNEAETFSKDLLKHIEDAGMAPPAERCYDQRGTGDEYQCFAYDTHEWEPEDDTSKT
jgi:hypothetical protein